MTWSCPASIEDALWAAAAEVLGDPPLAPRRLREAIIERSRLYTSERELLAQPSDPDADLAARALFFTVADAPKAMVPIAELALRSDVHRPLSVLDLGAGCGAMLWGLMASRGASGLSVTAVDRDDGALAILAAAATRLRLSVTTHTADAHQYRPTQKFDLIFVGSMLNELQGADALVARLIAALATGGALIIVEPALRETARALHRLRDLVIERELASVYAPCVRAKAPCPALADERDWCHEDRPTELPPRARRLGDETSLRRYGLKFSYLVLRTDGLRLVDTDVPAARVVSRVRKLKGKWEGFVCSDVGRERVTLLKRALGADNRVFTELERGDVVIGVREGRVEAGRELRRWRPEPSE